MRKIILFRQLSTAFQLLWILVFSFPAFAQEKREYTLFNGTRVYFSLDSDAPDTLSHLTSRIQVADLNTVNRILVDQKSGVFFGYTLKVELIGNNKQYRIFLQPLSNEQITKIKSSKWYEQANETKQNLRAGAAPVERKPQPDAALAPITRYPPPQTIDDGDTIAVDVLVNPNTGTKLTDRVTITARELPALTANTKSARDFTLDDVELRVNDYQVLVNNKTLGADKNYGGCGGSIIWVYVPQYGRFIFSITPRAGFDFQKTASIEDNKILFAAEGNFYEWRSQNPIINNGGKWNLWMLHDKQYQPDQTEAPKNSACCLHGSASNVTALFTDELTTVASTKPKAVPKPIVEPNKLAPELYADELLIKHMLVNLPGANFPNSKWEISWQAWFISEAEQKRVEDAIANDITNKTFAWNPRPENYPNKIALANGVFNQIGLEQLQDRINISAAFPFKAKIPAQLQTKFASLMISYNVKIFDAKLNRTITRSGIWVTKPFDDDPNNPLRSIPRTMLHSNWYVTESGEVFTSQEPRRTMSTKWSAEN